MMEHVFAGLDGGERQEKPRAAGLTMVIDWGMGPNAQEDLLAVGSAFFDFAKVAVGVSRLLPDDVLRRKIRRYRECQIEPFPGGQFLEYAEREEKSERYLPAVVEAGYRWVEVSDNLTPAGLAWKQRLIRQAVEEFGLKVLGEVGKKEGLAKGLPMIDDARACLEAGASIVLLEAAELVRQETAAEVEAVVEEAGLERVMFELPGPWIEGVSHHHIHRMRGELISRYGAQVNLGNVNPVDLMPVETFRRGLGVNAGHASERIVK